MRPSAGVTLPGNRWDLLAGVEPEEPPSVTVVVAHYEQPRELARTLVALSRQTHPADRLQVVVADDGSREAPVVPPGVGLVRQEDRGFRAAAVRNLGAREALGDVLCFLDADTAPEPAYVERMVRLPALAPEVVVVGRREHADLRHVDVGEPVETAGPGRRLEPPGWLADGYRLSHDLLDADDRSYRFVISSVMACSRWLFEELGGFDESFTRYGGEDWEWAYRAWEHGALLAHERRAVAWHDGPDWAARPSSDPREQMNDQTSRLVRRGLPGVRARGLRLAPSDVEVVLPAAPSPESLLVVVDGVLTALPEAEVWVADDAAGWLDEDERVHPLEGAPPGRGRVEVRLHRCVRLRPEVLRGAVDRVLAGPVARLDLVEESGRVAGVVIRLRAARRGARWDRSDLFPAASLAVGPADVVDVPARPDLGAYLGGWSTAGE